MRRRQLFEFNDQPWLPPVVRDAMIESLGRGIRWGHYFDRLVPPFVEFLRQARSDRILDLCSGGGEPLSVFLDALVDQQQPLPDVVMSDLFPNVPSLARVASRYPGRVSFIPDPVDATNVPPDLSRPVRTYINCMHHFPPELVRRMLADCVASRSAVFVIESFPRNLRRAVAQAPSLIAAALANPLLSPSRQLTKALLTYAGPVFWFGAFDWFASVCRIHMPHELLAIAKTVDQGSYAWRHGTAPFPFGGQSLWFAGLPM